MMKKAVRRIIIPMTEGLGVTNASLLATTIKRSDSYVSIECNGRSCTGMEITDLLAMKIGPGDLVSITARGDDAEDVIRRIDVLFSNDLKHIFNNVYSRTFQKVSA